MNISESEATGTATVKRAIFTVRSKLNRKAKKDPNNTPVITGLKELPSPIPTADVKRDFLVTVRHDGTERECRLHIEAIDEDGTPPVFRKEKYREAFQIVVRTKDRFCQIINRVAKCIQQLAAIMRRELNEQRYYLRTGKLPTPKQPVVNRRKERKWVNRFQSVQFSH